MKTRTLTHFQYRGVAIEIAHPAADGYQFCFYLYLNLEMFADKAQADSMWISPGSGYPLTELDWHCGISYYCKLYDYHDNRIIKVGCDYDHLWDRNDGYPATLESVIYDAKQCVDSFRQRYDYRFGTPQRMFTEEQIEYADDSKEYWAKREGVPEPEEKPDATSD